MFDWWWEFLFLLTQSINSLIDGIFKLYLILAGAAPESVIEEVTGNTANIDLIQTIFNDKIVQGAFFGFLGISVFVLGISIIIGLVRSEISTSDGVETKKKILKNSLKAILTVILIPVIFYIGIVATSTIVFAIMQLLGGADFTKNNLAQKLFEICLPKPNKPMESIPIWKTPFSLLNADYTMSQFNYMISFLVGFFMIIILALSAITLVERIINIILLFLISPIIVAVTPLDDGNRLGIWKDQVISKLLGVAGMIICFYLYFMIVPIITDYFPSNTFIGQLAMLIFALGGLFAAWKGSVVIANLVGHSTGMSEGQQIGQNLHAIMGIGNLGLKGTALMAKGAAGALKGGKKAFGALSKDMPNGSHNGLGGSAMGGFGDDGGENNFLGGSDSGSAMLGFNPSGGLAGSQQDYSRMMLGGSQDAASPVNLNVNSNNLVGYLSPPPSGGGQTGHMLGSQPKHIVNVDPSKIQEQTAGKGMEGGGLVKGAMQDGLAVNENTKEEK